VIKYVTGKIKQILKFKRCKNCGTKILEKSTKKCPNCGRFI